MVEIIAILKPEVVVQSGHILGITDASFSPNGKMVATASADETIRLWDLRLGSELRVLLGHTGPVYSVRFNHDCTILASASYDRTVRLWEIPSGREIQVFQEGLNLPMYQVRFDHTGAFLAASSQHYRGRCQAFV